MIAGQEWYENALAIHEAHYEVILSETDEPIVHDFDPSGDEHHPACMCPCCDLAEGKM